ncbi:MAG: carbonic anhydrase [Actinomycetota bacterium]|nr:carbonic anhydrase [Actinomycetota bacterium]
MNLRSDEALIRLREGNARFAEERSSARFSAEHRAAVVGGQRPWAVIVGCSDSRVPVEAVFDVGVGELFVVRNAGHVVDDAGLASIRFAIEGLGARTIVVLGHEECGAVSAALAGSTPAWLAPVIDRIDVKGVDSSNAPADAENPLLAAAVDRHVENTVLELKRRLASHREHENPTVVGAAYNLSSGLVRWLN